MLSKKPFVVIRHFRSASRLAKDQGTDDGTSDLTPNTTKQKKEVRTDLSRLRELLFQKSAKVTNFKPPIADPEQPAEPRPSTKAKKTTHTDLPKLKELLLQKSAKVTNFQPPIADPEPPAEPRPSPKARKTTHKTKKDTNVAGQTVDVTKITNMLTSLSRSSENHEKSSTPSKKNSEILKQPINLSPQKTVEVDKIKEVLVDRKASSHSVDEALFVPGQAPDAKLAVERKDMKQTHFRSKGGPKSQIKIPLDFGPRTHMFDQVVEKWAEQSDDDYKSIFQEMHEQAVRDQGKATIARSGFHDLIENVNKQWSFPIDNEECKTNEEGVGFDEHVFLEHHLSEFPKTGNIRQFMELVVTGLQQNPHLSVKEKKEHIEWFKDYFENIPDEQVKL